MSASSFQKPSMPIIDIATQPIMELANREIVAHEALSRFPDSELTPERYYRLAWREGWGAALEYSAAYQALCTHREGKLFVNISPLSLLQGWPQRGIDPALWAGAVVEITEHHAVLNYAPVIAALNTLREYGALVAVDDYATLHAREHLRALGEVEYVKVDRSVVTQLVSPNPLARDRAARVVDSALGKSKIAVIAEGVELESESLAAATLGVTLGQGYLFGRPQLSHSDGPR